MSGTEPTATNVEPEEVLIDQDHKRGPGWFLIAAYVVISLFCLYYLYTHWNWQSDYDRQQEEVNTRIEQTGR